MSDIKTDYELLDSGHERRLERLGSFIVDRPAPQAFWKPFLDEAEWNKADAIYERSSKGGGRWRYKNKLPENFEISFGELKLMLKPTGFGHLGFFPEQAKNWEILKDRIESADRKINLFNLFAYTGVASVVASLAGAEVCHVDSSKGIVSWARENARLNGLQDNPIRWMVEDAIKFLKREFRRGHRYQALVLDPPTFGRGNKGEVWKIERDLPELLASCRSVLSDDPELVMLSTYSPKFTPEVLGNMLDDTFGDLPGQIVSEEMSLFETRRKRNMPNGVTTRWLASR